MSLDPITTEVIHSRFREVAASMAHALFHSGYSLILRESQDGTAGLTDALGQVIVVGGGLQYHSVLYGQAVQSVLQAYPAETIRDGDTFLSNDPYKVGNSHVPDMVTVTPVFYRGDIIAFGVSVAHKADVGGLVPGSSGADAREIFHDGLLLPPVRYWTGAGVNREVEAIIGNNSRVPEVVIGDLRGQVGATRLGVRGVCALCDEYGLDAILDAMSSLLSTTTARLRRIFSSWPDGEAETEGLLDHDLVDRDRPVRIRVCARKNGDRLVLDFSSTGAQGKGPVNVPKPTARAISLLAVLAASDPTIPMNAGVVDAVDFVTRPGTVVDPQFPATVNHYFPTSHMVYSCVLAALGQFNPARAVAPAGFGTGAIAVGYARPRPGHTSVQYELMTTGLGGTSDHDGTGIVLAINHFMPSTPIEVLETEYPVSVRRFDVWKDSPGAGRQRGGIGYVREYEVLEDCVFTIRSSNHLYGGWGVRGGKEPPLSCTTINPDGPNAEKTDYLQTVHLEAGTVIRLEQTGGGGYGDPLQRATELVRQDVIDGYVSREQAAELYGVVIEEAGNTVDVKATRRRRDRMSKAR